MATQADVDALTALEGEQSTAIATVAADLTASQGKIQTELDSLQAQVNAGTPVSLDALTAAVQANKDALAPLDAAAQAAGNSTPTPPAPAPTPPPGP